MPNALLSVYDKTGIADFAAELAELGWNIYSSGGTAGAIAAAGVPVTDVAELTGFPAILDHRVVTLHPRVHGGILGVPDKPQHQADMEAYGIEPFGLVVGGLYPFSDTVASGVSWSACVEQIDVGGPTMLRGAAKNHAYVGVVTSPADYETVLQELRATGQLSDSTRLQLAIKAFAHTAAYDLAITEWISNGGRAGVLGEKVEDLKYGENPYMKPAGLYGVDDNDPLAVHQFRLVEGDSRSLVGLTDVDRLLQYLTHIAAGFEHNFAEVPYIAAGVKHGNACGAAVGSDPVTVIKQMVAGDKRAIFGGVIMTNFPVTERVAEALMERDEDDPPRLFDGIFAPSFGPGASEVLKRYKGKCRMMTNSALSDLGVTSLDATLRIRQVRGGFLRQPNFTYVLDLNETDIRGGQWLRDQHCRDLVLAWAIGCVSNSNTITLVRQGQLIGNGVGQQDRVGAAELAVKRARDAGHLISGAVAYSDSFFPAPDGPGVLVQAGVTAIFTSSGSKRDDATVDVCVDNKVTLVMQPDSEVRGFANH